MKKEYKSVIQDTGERKLLLAIARMHGITPEKIRNFVASPRIRNKYRKSGTL
jgi:hypothetical protein